MECTLGSGLIKHVGGILKQLAVAHDFLVLQMRCKQVCMSIVNANLSSLFLISIPDESFEEYRVPEGEEEPSTKKASKISIQRLVDAIKTASKGFKNKVVMAVTKNCIIIRSGDDDPFSHTVIKLNYEETALLRAAHMPIAEYPIRLVTLTDTLKGYLKSLGCGSIVSIDTQFDIHPKHGCLLQGAGKSASRALIERTDLFEFEAKQATSVILNNDDLLMLCNLGIASTTSVSLFIESAKSPVIVKLSSINGIEIKGVISALAGDEESSSFSEILSNPAPLARKVDDPNDYAPDSYLDSYDEEEEKEEEERVGNNLWLDTKHDCSTTIGDDLDGSSKLERINHDQLSFEIPGTPPDDN